MAEVYADLVSADFPLARMWALHFSIVFSINWLVICMLTFYNTVAIITSTNNR